MTQMSEGLLALILVIGSGGYSNPGNHQRDSAANARTSIAATAAAPKARVQVERPGLDEAIFLAAERWGLPYQGLKSIQLTETGHKAGMELAKAKTSGNSNGTVDHGVMQINSSWLPKLKKYGVTSGSLQNHETNAHISAWFLKNISLIQGTDLWDSMGWYNAVSPERRKRYIDAAHANSLTIKTQPSVRAEARKGYEAATSYLRLPEPGSPEAREFFDTKRKADPNAAAPYETGLVHVSLSTEHRMEPIHASANLRRLAEQLGEDDPKLKPPADAGNNKKRRKTNG